MVETTSAPVETENKEKQPVVEKPQEPADETPENPASTVSNQQNADASALDLARRREGKVPEVFGSVELVQSGAQAAPTLDRKTLETHAKSLHDAIHNRWLGVFGDVDKDKINRILEPLSPADRKALEQIYREKFGKGDSGPNFLRDELKGKLSDVEFRRTEAVLNREPGRTNDAGALQVALTTMRDDPERGNKELRNVLKTLTADQVKLLDQDFRAQFGEGYLDAIKKARGLSPENRAALDYLTVGSDKRTAADITKAAGVAMAHGNKEMLAQVVAGDSPQAQAARQQLRQDSTFMADFNRKYGRDQVMNDFIKDGRVSLSTIAVDNTDNIWFLNNKDNVKLAAKNASEKEQRDFAIGRELALQKKEPTTQQERDALAFYQKIHTAFGKSGDARDVQVWEDQLLRRGSLVSDLIDSYDTGWAFGLGSGTKKQDLFSKIENMSEADWKRLKDPVNGAGFKRDLEMALGSFASEGERTRAMKLIQDKMNAGTYDESKAIRRTVVETIQDNKGSAFLGMGTSYDGKNIAEQIGSMPAREREKYRTDPEYRKQLDDFVKNNLNDTEKLYAQRILERTRENRQPTEQEKKIDAVLLNGVKGEKREQQIRDVEALLSDKAVRERLNKPDGELSTEDRTLKRVIENQIVAAAYNMSKVPPDLDHNNPQSRNPMVERMRKPLFEEGRLPVDMKMRLGFPKSEILLAASQATVPEAERQAVMRRLSPEERQIVENGVKQNGQLTLADKVRGMVVGDGTKYETFKQDLEKLNPAQMQKLKDEYAQKYGSTFNDDFLKKVDEKDQIAYKTLITPQKADSRQIYYDMTKQLLDNGGGTTVDGTTLTLDRATKMYEENLEKYGGNLPPEVQKQLTEYFGESLKQYKDSKEKLAEVIVDATITVLAITATIASGGVLGPAAIAAIAASSAAFRVAAKKAIQGGSFELTAGNVLREGGIGALTGTLAALGPETFALIGRTGTIAVASTGRVLAREGVETLVEQGLLKGGRETAERTLSEKIGKVLTNNLVNGEKVGVRQVDDIARSLMDDTAQAALKSADPLVREAAEQQMQVLSKAIRAELGDAFSDKARQTGSEWLADVYYNTVLKSARNNAIVGGASNVAAEPVYSFMKGEGLNYDKLIQGGFTGLAFGAIAPIGFKGVFKAVEVGASGVGKLSSFTGDIVTRLSRTADGKIEFDPAHNPHISKFELPGKNPGDPPTIVDADALPSGQKVVLPEGSVPVMRTNADGQLVDKQGRLVNADGTVKSETYVRAANEGDSVPTPVDRSNEPVAALPEGRLKPTRVDAIVDVNRSGEVTDTLMLDGRAAKFKYEVVDGKRQLSNVVYTRPDLSDPSKNVEVAALYQENGRWMEWRRGESPRELHNVENVNVDAEGNVVTKFRSTSPIDTVMRQPDGTTLTDFRNGSAVRTFSNGQVSETLNVNGERALYQMSDTGDNATLNRIYFEDKNQTPSAFERTEDGKWKIIKSGQEPREWEGTITVSRDGVRTEVGKTEIDGYLLERRISPDGTIHEQFRAPDGSAVGEIPEDVRALGFLKHKSKIAFEQQGLVVTREGLTTKDVAGGKVTTDADGRTVETIDSSGVVRRFIYPEGNKKAEFDQVVELHPSQADPSKLEPRSTYIKTSDGSWQHVHSDGRPPEQFPYVKLEGDIFRTGDAGVSLDGRKFKHESGAWLNFDKDGNLIGTNGYQRADFEYTKDAQGKPVLSKVTTHGDSGPVVQERLNDSQWSVTHPDGRKEIFTGKVTVSDKGTVQETRALSGGAWSLRTSTPGGSSDTAYFDRNWEPILGKPNFRLPDENGRLSMFTDPTGQLYRVQYNPDGSIKELTWPGNRTWKQSESDPSIFTGPGSSKMKVENLKVASDGEISLTVDGTAWTMRSDGSRLIDAPTKTMKIDATGNVTELKIKADGSNPEAIYRMQYDGEKLVRVDVGNQSYVKNPQDQYFYHQPSGKKLGQTLELHNSMDTIAVSNNLGDFADVNPASHAGLRINKWTAEERVAISASTWEHQHDPNFAGKVDSEVGQRVLDLGRREQLDFYLDGSRREGFPDRVALHYDPSGRITKVVNSNYTSTSFGYTNGALTEVRFADRTLTKQADGNWYRAADPAQNEKAPVMVAKDIELLPNGVIRISPADDIRYPGNPNAVEAVDYRVDGKPYPRYKNAVNTPDSSAVVSEATDLERLNARTLDRLRRSPEGEPRFSTTRGELVKRPDGTTVERQVSGATLTWDKQGKLIAGRDSRGLDVRYTYDADGKLDSAEYMRNGAVQGRIVSEAGTPGQPKVWFSETPEGVRTRLTTTVDVTADGSLSFTGTNFHGRRIDADGVEVRFDKNLRETIDGTPENIAIQKKHLEHLRDTLFDDPNKKARFSSLMNDFETRMNARAGGDIDDQIANTYYSLRKMMEADVAAIPRNQRAVLAEQLLYMLSRPHMIDQGDLPTCNVTSEVLTRLFAKNPADAIRLVTDPAVSGKFITSEGVIVDMRRINGGLAPMGQARDTLGGKFQYELKDIKTDGQYNFAEWIAMATSINVDRQSRLFDYGGIPIRRATTIDELRKGVPYRPGDFKYDYQNKLDWGFLSFLGGKELMLTSEGVVQRHHGATRSVVWDPISGAKHSISDGARMTSPGLTNDDLVKLSRQIVGKDEEIHFFTRFGTDATSKGFKNVDDFRNEILALQRNGELPVTLYVDTRHPPFGGSMDRGGAHVVTLHRIFQDQHGDWRAEFSNQWGSGSNYMPDSPKAGKRSYPLSRLYDAMESLPSNVKNEDKFDKIQKFQRQSSAEKRAAIYRWLSSLPQRIFGRKVEGDSSS